MLCRVVSRTGLTLTIITTIIITTIIPPCISPTSTRRSTAHLNVSAADFDFAFGDKQFHKDLVHDVRKELV